MTLSPEEAEVMGFDVDTAAAVVDGLRRKRSLISTRDPELAGPTIP
jgi:hypothetical protein